MRGRVIGEDGRVHDRPDLVALVQEDGPVLFAFLLAAGFDGPERTSDGIAALMRGEAVGGDG
ncbi:hypothetical protein C1I92_19580 [Jiangella anatolica]|uniref:Uncharacterized protein n=1 Tax=Jiangella anatolica TaxID=2670374 RepID=A0A2W2C1I5_9ACTN|nr:hypothetical protein C1I92_19580 [Jiangella anatolica]